VRVSMREKITAYNTKILKELSEKFPQKWEKIKYKNKMLWLEEKDFPTYNQLVEISKIFNIPFGYLFLDSLPEHILPIPHYRTSGYTTFPNEVSDELLDTIYFVKNQQEWIKELLIEWGNEPLPFAGKYNIHSDIDVIVSEMRPILELENDWASQQFSWNDAFKILIEKFEKAGIFVVINGIVGNNTHRKLNVNEFRGFVLYDEVAPFVFINNNDAISGKIFTLIHELVHILIGQSASFDLRNLQSANNEIEQFCDKCTAEFLVPEESIKDIKNIDSNSYEILAKRFKVSQIVIARRLLDTGKISKDEFYDFYNEHINKEFKKSKSSGGDFYNAAQYRYGKRFLSVIRNALENNNIFYRDVFRLLGLNHQTSLKVLSNL